ncbi:hypothetical protein [Shouchella shacheensis]|nr:hypothetical protein [Shouchella shacheensis]
MKKKTKKVKNAVLPAFVTSPFTSKLQKKNKEAISLLKKQEGANKKML